VSAKRAFVLVWSPPRRQTVGEGDAVTTTRMPGSRGTGARAGRCRDPGVDARSIGQPTESVLRGDGRGRRRGDDHPRAGGGAGRQISGARGRQDGKQGESDLAANKQPAASITGPDREDDSAADKQPNKPAASISRPGRTEPSTQRLTNNLRTALPPAQRCRLSGRQPDPTAAPATSPARSRPPAGRQPNPTAAPATSPARSRQPASRQPAYGSASRPEPPTQR
jgi:hypothetical protein